MIADSTTRASAPSFSLQDAPTRAISVSALLGDSLVVHKNVNHPRQTLPPKQRMAIMGLGAILLLLSAVTFFSAVSGAADNKERYQAHLQAGNLAHQFRPAPVHPAYDWMAIGGLLGGIFCFVFVRLRKPDKSSAPSFRIGSAPGVDLPLSDITKEDFLLVAPQGHDFVANVLEEWQGELYEGALVTSFAELKAQGRMSASLLYPGAREIQIPQEGEIRIQKGNQQFVLRAIPLPRKVEAPLWGSMDSTMLSYIAATAIAILSFVFFLDTLLADQKTMAGDNFDTKGRLAYVRMLPAEDAIEKLEKSDAAKGDSAGGSGATMAEASGKMGTKDSANETGRYRMKNNHVAPTLSREHALALAQSAGILGVFQNSPESSFQSVLASADFSSGTDALDIFGGHTGMEAREAGGGWGYGITGIELGGGCTGTGCGTIGTGRYALIGDGTRVGSDYVSNHGRDGRLPGHNTKLPTVIVGPASASPGGLDRKIIRRYVQKKLNRIRHCYEKELLAKPTLRGTLSAQFLISPHGKVQGVKITGMKNANVAGCVQNIIASIQFPEPRDNSYVNVRRYPFTFQPAEG